MGGTHTLLRTKYPTTEFWYFAASKAAGLGVKENIHLHLALILRTRWALPVLPLRLHGAALNKAQDKLYLTGPEHVNKLLNYVYCSAFLVTCPGAWQLYGIESQHPLRRPVTAAVLRDTILRHIHNSPVHTKDYHRMYQKIRFRTAKNSVTSKSVFYFETSPWILCYYWHASRVINIFQLHDSTAWN